MNKQSTNLKRSPYNLVNAALAAVYISLACGMYYFHDEYLDFGIHLMYKFMLSVALVALSFLIFLARTDLVRGRVLLRYTVLLSLPHLAIIMASVPVWVFRAQKLTQIRRGLFDQLYGLSVLLAVAGILYVFGRRGLWINLAAMLAANLITAVRVILENGLFVYLNELRDLIVTFAKETGPVIQQMEIHELTFALGVYLVLYAADWREIRKEHMACLMFVPTLFCFLSGFKRIGIAAIAAALFACLVIRLSARKHGALFWLLTASFAGALAAFVYICLVKWGIFEFLASYFGLDTMGRRELSSFIDRYYWIGLDYWGNGAGFVTRMFSDLPARYTIRALHNDILAIYIDAGFWGFGIWMLCWLPLRVWLAYKWQGLQGGIVCLCLHTYVLATAATDNTLYYIYVTGAVDIAIMSFRLETQEIRQRRAAYA